MMQGEEGGEEGCRDLRCADPAHCHGNGGESKSSSGSDEEEGGEEEARAAAGEAGAAHGKARGSPASESISLGGSSEDEEEEDEEAESESSEEEGPDEELVFPADFLPALEQLLATAPPPGALAAAGGVAVRDIALPTADLRLQLAAALYEEGVLCTLPRASTKQGGKKAAASRGGGEGAAGEPHAAKRQKQAA